MDAARRSRCTTVITVLGLVGAGLVIWAVLRYDLIHRAGQAVGLG